MSKDDTQRTMCSAAMAWRTSIKRKKLSRPASRLIALDLIKGRLLDYGCGRGDDADKLGCERYDPHFEPVMPDGKFDTIMCNYVLNVIEEPASRIAVLRDIQSRLAPGGRAYISVRANKKDLKGLTSIGTWQGLVTLSLPVVYSDRDSVTYELRPGHIGIVCKAETFPESA